MSLPADLPTPVDVPTGHLVRVRLGGHCYHSAFMAPSEAAALASRVVSDCSNRHEGFIEFATADGRTVRIRARAVSAVEAGPPPPHWRDRDRRLDEPIGLLPVEAYPLVPGGLSRADLEAAGYTVAVPSSAGHPDRADDDLQARPFPFAPPARPTPATIPHFPPNRPRPVRDNPQA